MRPHSMVSSHAPSPSSNFCELDNSQLLRDRVSAALWPLGKESLVDVCRYLKCDGLYSGEPCSKARRMLIKMAESVLDEIEEKQEDDEVTQFFTDLQTFVEKLHEERMQTDKEMSAEESATKKGLGEKYFLPHHLFQRMPDYPFKSRPGQAHMLPEVTLRSLRLLGKLKKVGIKRNCLT